MAQRNNIKNIWYRTKNPALRPVLNNLTTQVRSLMRLWKTSLWHDTLNKTHGDHRSFWRLVRSKIAKRRSVLLSRPDSVMDPHDQAVALAAYMADDARSRVVVGEEAPLAQTAGNYMYVSPRQLNAILRRTKGNKSPGLDNVQYVLLRQLPRKALAFFAHLLNSCIRLRHFPTCWKHAVVVPLLKPAKNGTLPEHYRPISLLPHMSKILEKVLLKYLTEYCDEENLIPPEQAGFRSGLSVEHPLARLQSDTTLNLRHNRATALISIDCTKAFDSVDHDTLLHKLRHCDCPEQLYNILHSYLKGRTFQVRVGNSLSPTHSSPCGVPQGSVLAPTLFSIYTGHIVGRHYEHAKISAYADDIAIYSTSMNPTLALKHAESACQDISDRLREINIAVNPTKTDALLFSFLKKRGRTLPTRFRLDGTYIPLSQNITYLGVHLDRQLSFTTHVQRRIKTVRRRFLSLKHLLLSPNLSLRLKLLIYKGVLRPSLLFAAPILRYLTATSLKQLQSLQNNILRKIIWHTSHRRQRLSVTHAQLNLPTVTDFIKKRHVKFFDSIRHTWNPIFNTLTPPSRPNTWNEGRKSCLRLKDVLEQ